MSEKYILDGHTPVAIEDLFAWGRWMETADRHVAATTTRTAKVSTVFLGLNHQYSSGPPLLFETMIFGGPRDGYQERYATWDEAEAGHARAVQLADLEDAHGDADNPL